jgi:hypothetical protein
VTLLLQNLWPVCIKENGRRFGGLIPNPATIHGGKAQQMKINADIVIFFLNLLKVVK